MSTDLCVYETWHKTLPNSLAILIPSIATELEASRDKSNHMPCDILLCRAYFLRI